MEAMNKWDRKKIEKALEWRNKDTNTRCVKVEWLEGGGAARVWIYDHACGAGDLVVDADSIPDLQVNEKARLRKRLERLEAAE